MLSFQNDFVYAHEIMYVYDGDLKIVAIAFRDGSIRFSCCELSLSDTSSIIDKVNKWCDE